MLRFFIKTVELLHMSCLSAGCPHSWRPSGRGCRTAWGWGRTPGWSWRSRWSGAGPRTRRSTAVASWKTKYICQRTSVADRDPVWKKVGSGIRIRHPGSTTLPRTTGGKLWAGTIFQRRNSWTPFVFKVSGSGFWIQGFVLFLLSVFRSKKCYSRLKSSFLVLQIFLYEFLNQSRVRFSVKSARRKDSE